MNTPYYTLLYLIIPYRLGLKKTNMKQKTKISEFDDVRRFSETCVWKPGFQNLVSKTRFPKRVFEKLVPKTWSPKLAFGNLVPKTCFPNLPLET